MGLEDDIRAARARDEPSRKAAERRLAEQAAWDAVRGSKRDDEFILPHGDLRKLIHEVMPMIDWRDQRRERRRLYRDPNGSMRLSDYVYREERRKMLFGGHRRVEVPYPGEAVRVFTISSLGSTVHYGERGEYYDLVPEFRLTSNGYVWLREGLTVESLRSLLIYHGRQQPADRKKW